MRGSWLARHARITIRTGRVTRAGARAGAEAGAGSAAGGRVLEGPSATSDLAVPPTVALTLTPLLPLTPPLTLTLPPLYSQTVV
jgi:hypothetical protein